MSLREFFSRSKENVNELASEVTLPKEENRVTCDTSELKEQINKWTKNEGWEFKDFATFVELIGVKTPIKISDWDEENYSFKCITALNTELTLHIRFGDGFDFYSELWVTEGQETSKYFIKYNSEKGKTIPKPTLEGRNITRDGKELNSYYCKLFCHITLKLDDTHMLKIEISEPNRGLSDDHDIAVLRNNQQIEAYLLTLDTSLVMAQVYDKVMELLEFSNEEISNSEQIWFCYTETIDNEKRTRSEIAKANGIMQKYAVLENGETFHVSRDGSWEYLSNNTRIIYHKKQNHYVFSITGDEANITTANPAKTMSYVKEKIFKLMDFVK